ncbi:MAG: FxsA family protein [Rhodospirillaceae bacterium]|nr:FxsA family protein [Rhodospirillaceae bacterium]
MALLILLVLIGTPIVEIAVFIEVGDRVGLWPTVGGILATAAIGMAIIRIQGFTVLSRAQENLQAERFPALEIFDGVCLVLAGAMLITPGFVTDTFGFLLLIVPLRRLAARGAWSYASRRGFNAPPNRGTGTVHGTTVIDGEFQEVPDDPEMQDADNSTDRLQLPDQTVVRNDDP